MNNELEKVWKEAVLAYFEVRLILIHQQFVRRNWRNPRRRLVSTYGLPGWDFKQGAAEYEAELLNIRSDDRVTCLLRDHKYRTPNMTATNIPDRSTAQRHW
jgi:hypothetical protein